MRVITSIAACFIPTLIGWIGGMELERGPYLAITVGMGLAMGASTVTFPWDDE